VPVFTKAYKSWKEVPEIFDGENVKLLLIGNVVAFIVAMLAIKLFISFLTKYGFKIFGWYRVIFGLLLLVLLAMGIDLKIV
jgi:undecaprenyl-diphosphatase